MKNDFENDPNEEEIVKEMIIELVYLRKVIDNVVYYGTGISLRATHLIDSILYYHDTGKKGAFTGEELRELINNIKSGMSEQNLLNLNINHINDSMENLDSILKKLLETYGLHFIYEDCDEIEEDFLILGDSDDE